MMFGQPITWNPGQDDVWTAYRLKSWTRWCVDTLSLEILDKIMFGQLITWNPGQDNVWTPYHLKYWTRWCFSHIEEWVTEVEGWDDRQDVPACLQMCLSYRRVGGHRVRMPFTRIIGWVLHLWKDYRFLSIGGKIKIITYACVVTAQGSVTFTPHSWKTAILRQYWYRCSNNIWQQIMKTTHYTIYCLLYVAVSHKVPTTESKITMQ